MERAAHLTALGRLLRQARQGKGLTLREVQQETGVNFVTISRLERGQTYEPGLFTVLTLAAFYGVLTDVYGLLIDAVKLPATPVAA